MTPARPAESASAALAGRPLRVIGEGEAVDGARGSGYAAGHQLVDYAILAIYFVVVLGIGFAAKRYIKTSLDYFLSGRSLPAWVTGLAFISANLGALEILGMAANGAQYGISTVHYYWIGAIPAMVFLGIVMMPFYYGSKVRSVPEYLRLRFNKPTHLFNALTLRVRDRADRRREPVRARAGAASCCSAGRSCSASSSPRVVLAYITLGGLSSAIYNEVLQFFVIVAGADPADDRRPARGRRLGRPEGRDRQGQARATQLLHSWAGHRDRQRRQPARRSWVADRLRPRLRALVRLLDDELRRGPARAVGQEPERRAAHAADRRLPEDASSRSITIIPGLIALADRSRASAATTATCSTTTRSRC